jgi:hypothetical protein
LPHTSARWCPQDGLVSWEPLFVEVLGNGVFARVQSFLRTLAAMPAIPHCTAFDPKTHACSAPPESRDGIKVLAEIANVLFDGSRTANLTDRQGNAKALRNDGTRTDPIAPIDLVVDSIKGIDGAFTSFAQRNPMDQGRQDLWRSARSQFVDTFLTVNGQGDQASFKNGTLIQIVPALVDVARAQIASHCPDPSMPCSWSRQDMAQSMSDLIGGPKFAAIVDLVDAIRKDAAGRAELETLVSYLLDGASANDAQNGMLAAVADMLQMLDDDSDFSKLEHLLSHALQAPLVDESGNVVRRGLVDAGIRSMSRIFEKTVDMQNACTKERDPNRALAAVLGNLVTPMGSGVTPLEVIAGVVADVNRASPELTTKLQGPDYGNMANEMSEFMLDPSRGLEQFYSVIKQATE